MCHYGHMVLIQESLRPLLVPINDVQQHPDNPNNGDVDTVRESIQVNTMYAPIKVQRSTRYIIGGNTTWAAMVSLGATHIPVVWEDVDDEAALRILLMDNESARKAVMDNSILAKNLAALAETERGLVGTGYTYDDLIELAREQETSLHFAENTTPLVTTAWGVIIECEDEAQQADLIAEFADRGLRVREVSL